MTSRLTVNAGLRWDMHVPWVEKDNKQSNFDVSTGRFVVASDSATINGVQVGRYLQTYGRPISVRVWASPTTSPAAARRLLRGGYGLLLELHTRRHVVVEGAEPAVPPGAGDDHELRHQHHPVAGTRGASRRQPHRRTRRVHAIGVPHGCSVTPTRTTSTSACSGRSAPTT